MAGREETNERMESTISTSRRWAEYLVAVLLGNVAYLLVEPQLPATMRHRMFRVDVGLGVDFLICVAIYAVVRLARGIEQ
jgi:hypothetical protein